MVGRGGRLQATDGPAEKVARGEQTTRQDDRVRAARRTLPFEARTVRSADGAPALHEAQNAWLAQIDSLRAPDRKTHELIRMVCTVIVRNPPGVHRHAMLAAEVGRRGRRSPAASS